MRRGELVGLRWRAVNLLEAKIEVRETYVRGRFTTPKSKASRRVVELGPRTLAVLEEQWRQHRLPRRRRPRLRPSDEGDAARDQQLATRYLKPALARAGSRSRSAPSTTSATRR